MNAVQLAVLKLGYGGQTKLAKALNLKPQNVQKWCATGIVPPKHVLKVEKLTGVSRVELCPSICA